MKNKIFKGFALIGVTMLLMVSCAKAPQVEIDAAKSAIDSAKEAGAEMYAQAEFLALQDSMNVVLAGVEAQNSKLFKDYSATLSGLANVSQLAAAVKEQTKAKKEAIKAEAEVGITEVTALIESGKRLLMKSPKGKVGASTLEAIIGELSALETSLTETSGLLASAEYNAALAKIGAAKVKASSINTELQEVVDKYSKAGKRK